MNRQQFEQLIKEELKAVLNEAKLMAGDNTFNIEVKVNRNPTKEGIKKNMIYHKPIHNRRMDILKLVKQNLVRLDTTH